MLKRTLLPALLIAALASLPALGSGLGAHANSGKYGEFQLTHSERIHDSAAPTMKLSALESGLPQAWCGTQTSQDQTVNSVNNSSPKFKFYYVRASDQPNRFDEVANLMQKSISTIHSYLLNVSNGSRTISIDLGTSCGPMYVDIGSLVLPGSVASYQDLTGEIDSKTAMDTLQPIADNIPGPPRHFVFLLDGFEPTNYIRGAGLVALDSSPGPGNHNNDPGTSAFVATPAGAVDQPVNQHLPRALLHEMTHTMGAVQGSAPNSTSAGHCTDGLDVMCYDDGSPEAAAYNPNVCAPPALSIAYNFDCHNDDYFSANPPAGSYLATKWNVYNSIYLLHCAASDPYCTSAPVGTPTPDNPAAKTVSNNLYLYKRGKRGKKLGAVSATGAREPETDFIRNSVKMNSIRVPRGTWKITICFREKGEPAVCESKRKKTPKSGKISAPRIYVTTSSSDGTAWGTVTLKPVSKNLRKKRYEVRTEKRPATYSLVF